MLPHDGGSVLHGLDDLVITGAAAQIAGEPVADLGISRIRVFFEQCLRSHEDAGGAKSALKGSLVDEDLLQGMQLFAIRHAFDGFDLGAFGFNAENQAGADQPAVDHDAACAAIAGAAAFLGARKAKPVTQDGQQAFIRRAKEIGFVAIDGGGYVDVFHFLPPARA